MTKFRGVAPHKDGGFTVHIGVDGGRKYIGYFAEFEAAKSARLNSEVEYFGAVFDRREIEIEDGYAKLPLHGQRGVFKGWALVDLEDLPSVQRTAWAVDPRGYVVGRVKGHGRTTLHRYLMPDAKVVDHRNGNRLDNRRGNLRQCAQAENSRNTRLGSNNTSGAKGVTPVPGGRWRARIWVDRKEIHVGTFDTREEAAHAYDKAALELHGEFASLNGVQNKRYAEVPGVTVEIEELEEQC